MTIDVGAHLKAVRTMYGLSQRELAKRAGVTNGTISLIEQNRVSPSVSSLKKVLDGVPMSLAEFFTLDLQVNPQVFFGRDDLTDIGHALKLFQRCVHQRVERLKMSGEGARRGRADVEDPEAKKKTPERPSPALGNRSQQDTVSKGSDWRRVNHYMIESLAQFQQRVAHLF